MRDYICDGCENDPDACGKSVLDCMADAEAARIDAAYELGRNQNGVPA